MSRPSKQVGQGDAATAAAQLTEGDAAALERASLVAENAELKLTLARQTAQRARAELDDVVSRLRKAYALGDADEVNLQTREIKRAPAAPPPPTKDA
jgi:hypothetical protein